MGFFQGLDLCIQRYITILTFFLGLLLSLRGTTYTTNNSVILLDDVGVSTSNALQCISDLSGCCLNPGRGQWYYPNGTQVPIDGTGYGFYRNRESNGQVFLRRRSDTISPTGTYCCQVPTAASGSNDETFCAFLSEFILIAKYAELVLADKQNMALFIGDPHQKWN